MSSKITPKVCISSISKKLYIIKTKSCISSLRKLFMHTKRCDEIQGRLAALDDIHRTSYGDDMPLLSQWIKKERSFCFVLFCKRSCKSTNHTLHKGKRCLKYTNNHTKNRLYSGSVCNSFLSSSIFTKTDFPTIPLNGSHIAGSALS